MFDRSLNAPILSTLRSTTIHVKHNHNTAQKRSFPLKISKYMRPNPQFPAESVTFTEEVLNEKRILCSINSENILPLLPNSLNVKLK